MKRVLVTLLSVLSLNSFAQVPLRKHIITHNRTTIVTNPATGTNSFVKWGVFPSGKESVRQVMLHVTLGTPDSMPTAHWDYLDRINLLRKGGMNGNNLRYELGRMLTPYGSVFGKGWSWTWEVDVTDFSAFLRDSAEIEYVHTGYEPVNVAWALTLDFEFVTGPPVLDFIGMMPLWNDAYKYGDPNEKIAKKLLPITYENVAGAGISRIRIQHTGHGMDKPKGCSEFCSRWRMIKVDGNIADHRNMWKDCGCNPLYPQGGTWIYDRAYWCPGDLQHPDIIDVAASAGKHSVSIEMEPYTAVDDRNAVEQIASYLFQYSKPRQRTDVALEKIMVPGNEQQYSRLNPASFNPRIIIRNLGSENLRSVLITYGTAGFPMQTFQWKGNLKFNQVEEVIIPGEILWKEGENTFNVTLTKPNGKADGWNGDNAMTSTFKSPEKFPLNFVLQFKTNKRPKDNNIFMVNSKLDTVFVRNAAQLDSDRVYNDTLRLVAGKYEIHLTDTAGDGLEFWAEPQNGDGYLRIFDLKGNLIHSFESDCGNGEMLSFEATPDFITDTVTPRYAFSLYPRLVSMGTTLNVVSNRTSNMTVLLTVGGKLYEKHEYMGIKNASFYYNMEHLPAGRIVMEVLMDGESRFKGRINKKTD